MKMIQILREKREAKGLSQTALAEESQVSVSCINKIERGLVSPRVDTLQIIAETLGITMRDLFEDPDPLD